MSSMWFIKSYIDKSVEEVFLLTIKIKVKAVSLHQYNYSSNTEEATLITQCAEWHHRFRYPVEKSE